MSRKRRVHKVGRLMGLIRCLRDGARTALAVAEGRPVEGDVEDDLEMLRVALDEASGLLKLAAWREAAREEARLKAEGSMVLVPAGPAPENYRAHKRVG
jgi:hypothetical protein